MAQALIAAERVTRTDAGRMLGMSRFMVGRLIESGDLVEVKLPIAIKATILKSSVEALAARISEAK